MGLSELVVDFLFDFFIIVLKSAFSLVLDSVLGSLRSTYIRDEFYTFDFMLNSVIVAISMAASIFQPLTLFFIDKVAGQFEHSDYVGE